MRPATDERSALDHALETPPFTAAKDSARPPREGRALREHEETRRMNWSSLAHQGCSFLPSGGPQKGAGRSHLTGRDFFLHARRMRRQQRKETSRGTRGSSTARARPFLDLPRSWLNN
ncbi:hypothetical protein HPB50_017190 [Hyalomma asiaticum]|uniref:Uncharacterized protein n=1 Tax=Hyalomma asiaticum TaxID=266040 RepID=A0ACB7TJK2_HYAAI|nr:hypothetical protein HPB50_017190 [Hyalomma asiaticum]